MNLPKAINESNFEFPGQTDFYKGKVRDVYEINDKYLVMLATDRISAFDVILPRAIPFKGEVLNLIAADFLEKTRSIIPNWLISVPHPAVSIGYKCKPFPVEMVIRGYLCGHAWREYKEGKRLICGQKMPDGMKAFQAFPKPIITPTTKAKSGHDEDISPEEIIRQGILDKQTYQLLEKYTYQLFDDGTKEADKRGLILADTKYEFGILNENIHLIDEIHTPDSSRYFYKEGFQNKIRNGEIPRQLSKEFVREWLISKGFQGKNGQVIPEMTDEVVNDIMLRYFELYEHIIGKKFKIENNRNNPLDDVFECIKTSLTKLQ